jgi:hypothetical protein
VTKTTIKATWEGDGFKPLPRFAKVADATYTVGEIYVIEAHPERSMASHKHYFARLQELWENLPEALSTLYPTTHILREHALIATGFCNSTSEVFSTNVDALRAAALMRGGEQYKVVTVEKRAVIVHTAMSQAVLMMDPDRFQRSKQRVLEYVEALVSIPAGERQQEGAA